MPWLEAPTFTTMTEFDRINAYNKKHYPLRYFFQETIPDMFSIIRHRVKRMYWAVIHRTHPLHRYHVVPTRLSPGYYDIPELMLHANFTFLCRFVEDEECFTYIDWEDNAIHACVFSELTDLYHWWTVEYPKRGYIEEALYDSIDNDNIDNVSEHAKGVYAQLNKIEQRWKEQDIYNLKRLVSIKDFMWT